VKFAKGQLFHNGRNPFSFFFFAPGSIQRARRPRPPVAARGSRSAGPRSNNETKKCKL